MEPLQFSPSPRERYEPNRYFGRNINKMPQLLADSRVPISMSEFMELRLYALDIYAKTLEHPKNFTREQIEDAARFFKHVYSNYADTGDAAIYHPDGKIKVNLADETGQNTEFLRLINPQSELSDGAITKLPSGLYAATKMPELSKADVKKYTGKSQIRSETIENKAWRIFARHPDEVPKEYAKDPNLLENYVKAENLLADIAFDYKENMGIYVANPQKDEVARLWRAGGLRYGSYAGGGGRLGYDVGRLVGVAPEAPRISVPTTERLEEIIATINQHKPEVKQLLAA